MSMEIGAGENCVWQREGGRVRVFPVLSQSIIPLAPEAIDGPPISGTDRDTP